VRIHYARRVGENEGADTFFFDLQDIDNRDLRACREAHRRVRGRQSFFLRVFLLVFYYTSELRACCESDSFDLRKVIFPWTQGGFTEEGIAIVVEGGPFRAGRSSQIMVRRPGGSAVQIIDGGALQPGIRENRRRPATSCGYDARRGPDAARGGFEVRPLPKGC